MSVYILWINRIVHGQTKITVEFKVYFCFYLLSGPWDALRAGQKGNWGSGDALNLLT